MHSKYFGDKFYETQKKYDALVHQLECLIAESDGVVGLHRNGEIADWEWLIDNDWLTFEYL